MLGPRTRIDRWSLSGAVSSVVLPPRSGDNGPRTAQRSPRFTVPELEEAIVHLRDVESVRVKAKGDVVEDIHVVTRSHRPPKQIGRDIVTLLEAKFRLSVDYRVVSVAKFENGTAEEDPVDGEDRPEVSDRATQGPGQDNPALEHRIRFGRVNVRVDGRRAEAEVELHWKGISRSATAAGFGTREGGLRLAAQATLQALEGFLDNRVGLSLTAADLVHVGRRDVAGVTLDLLAHREQKSLAGCCTVEGDVQEAVVLATLAALNRIVGGLPTREPTEYVLRPTSQ